MKYREAAIESESWLTALTEAVVDNKIKLEIVEAISSRARELANAMYRGEPPKYGNLERNSAAIEVQIEEANAAKQGYPHA